MSEWTYNAIRAEERAPLRRRREECGCPPAVMCRKCVPEAFEREDEDMTTRITSSDCGCHTVDGEQKLWCAHHVSGMQETITARERSITALRYRVRELEQERDKLRKLENVNESLGEQIQNILINLGNERDEWKAKAEREAAMGSDADNEIQRLREDVTELNATIRILRGQKRILAEENRGLRRHQEELQNATHYCCMHMRWETREGAVV